MNMSSLEKLAFEKDAGVMSLAWKAAKLGLKGANLGGKVAKYPLKGAANVAGKAITKASKKPIPLAVTGLTAAALLPSALKSTSYTNYKNKMDNPTNFNRAKHFGKAHDYSTGFIKRSEVNMTPMSYLEKEAALADDDWLSGAWKSFKKIPNKGAKAAGILGIGGLGAAAMSPTLSTLGKKVHKKFFNQSDRLDEEDEMAKAKMQAMGKHMADRQVKSYAAAYSKKQDTPKLESIMSSLKKNDPILNGASKDKKAY